MMSDEMPEGSPCRRGLAPTQLLGFVDASRVSDGQAAIGASTGAVGGDGGVPHLAGGDDRVQLPQQGRRHGGLGLGGLERMLGTGGQVGVVGGVDRRGWKCQPERAGFLSVDRRRRLWGDRRPAAPPSRAVTGWVT